MAWREGTIVNVYRITSPSGKSYIGITKRSVRVRWSAHVSRARASRLNHPFLNAIRKYGSEAFTVTVLATEFTEQQAKDVEVMLIDLYCTQDRNHGYNLSPGGDYDAGTGGLVFWGRLAKDPEAYEAHRAKMRVIGSRPWAKRQRLEGQLAKWADPTWRLWESADRTVYVRRVWASRGADERQEIGRKIGEKQAAHWASLDDGARAEKEAQVARARSKINRKKQGAAASRGVKSWWAELRSDPERYAEYIARRRDTLLKTLEEKKHAQG